MIIIGNNKKDSIEPILLLQQIGSNKVEYDKKLV